MKSPLDTGELVVLETVDSTQAAAESALLSGESAGVIFAHTQTSGKGRRGREWYSEKDHSLTVSFIFRDYANHPKPWLIGMAVALAAAGAVHARVAWPNDLMLGGKKVGGILSQIVTTPSGDRVPVVGLGINLNVSEFPAELAEIAANVEAKDSTTGGAFVVLEAIIERLSALPEPAEFADLKPIWKLFDETAGKRYHLTDGNIAVGIGVGADGELICAVDGETMTVLAADAIFGELHTA